MMLANYTKLKSEERSGFVEKTLHIKVITPVFGGGVSSESTEAARHIKVPDPITPIRGAAIRGQLRFWWRVLQKETDHQKLWEEERKIWGMASSPGAVSITVQTEGTWETVPVFRCEPKNSGKGWNPKPINGMEHIAYAAFPLQPPEAVLRQPTQPQAGDLHRLNSDVTVRLRVPIGMTKQVEDALTAWLLLGGVGGRTRRGFGSVVSDDLKIEDPAAWLKARGFCVEYSQPTGKDPMAAIRFGLGKLQRFRQGQCVGRNAGSDPGMPKKSGRSRWPEPECIRSLTEQSDPKHKERFVKVDKFPRAAFGLPIIFHFQSDSDPKDTTLKPVGFDRLASPLIIRPYRAPDGTYRCLAALLPYRDLDQVPLELVPTKNQANGTSLPARSVLTKEEACSYAKSPLRKQVDPLLAFLDFFQLPENQEQIR